MISSRYATAFLVLAALALVPTVIHSYARVVVDDGHKAAALPTTLAGTPSVPSGRNDTWGKRRFDSDDWIERDFTIGGNKLTLTVIRAYDLKALYHHPELAVAYHEGHTFEPVTTERFPQHPDVPVHILRASQPDTALSMYVLHYEGAFIDNPITFQLRTAFELLVSGRRPMTLLFVQDPTTSPQENLAGADATRLLFSAIDRFTAQAGTPIQ